MQKHVAIAARLLSAAPLPSTFRTGGGDDSLRSKQ